MSVKGHILSYKSEYRLRMYVAFCHKKDDADSLRYIEFSIMHVETVDGYVFHTPFFTQLRLDAPVAYRSVIAMSIVP